MPSKHLKENKSIVKRDPKHKVFCHEPYAQALYDLMCGTFNGDVSKDMSRGDIRRATVVSIDKYGIAVADTDSSASVLIDLNKEKGFFERQRQYNPDFGVAIGSVIDVTIENKTQGTFTASIEGAFNKELKRDLREALKTGNTAYTVTVKSVNEGGFLVDLQGIECFMPGSLAGANRILDFNSMIGKKVIVMVETFLEHSEMFVVSAKKYIQKILPTKIKELDFSVKYTGSVTGTAAYGAFVEWDGIFTGLLHESEIQGVALADLRPGDQIEFFVKDVKEDNRVILTQKEPSPELMLYQTFKEEYEGTEVEGTVREIKPFGIFIEFEGGAIGMMPPREFKKTGGRVIKEGDSIDCYIKQVDVAAKKIQVRCIKDEDDEE